MDDKPIQEVNKALCRLSRENRALRCYVGPCTLVMVVVAFVWSGINRRRPNGPGAEIRDTRRRRCG